MLLGSSEINLKGFVQVAGMKIYDPPPRNQLEWPETRKLPNVEKAPQYLTMKPPTMQKFIFVMRGPELVHNFFIHKQYGIVALTAGRMEYRHFEALRQTINSKLDANMFAIWRVDSPWQACSKRSAGHPMGGGKGRIHHYVTPIKAGRVILELAGNLEYLEASRILKETANKLPFRAAFVTHEQLEEQRLYKERLKKQNMNPYDFEYVVKNNLGGCKNWCSPYDCFWYGEHI